MATLHITWTTVWFLLLLRKTREHWHLHTRCSILICLEEEEEEEEERWCCLLLLPLNETVTCFSTLDSSALSRSCCSGLELELEVNSVRLHVWQSEASDAFTVYGQKRIQDKQQEVDAQTDLYLCGVSPSPRGRPQMTPLIERRRTPHLDPSGSDRVRPVVTMTPSPGGQSRNSTPIKFQLFWKKESCEENTQSLCFLSFIICFFRNSEWEKQLMSSTTTVYYLRICLVKKTFKNICNKNNLK